MVEQAAVRRPRVLVVDDEEGIRAIVRAYGTREGFDILEAADGDSAARIVDAAPRPDLVVLDLMVPGIDGWTLCRRWTEAGSPPVIILSARGAEAERVLGLGLGADDYVTKPFSPIELMARIRAVLRRAERAQAPAGTDHPAPLRVGDLSVDVDRRRAHGPGGEVIVTRRGFDLLARLAEQGDRVSTRLDLLLVLGDGEVSATDRAVDQHVVAIRRALDAVHSGVRIEAVRGIGYRLVPGS